MAPAGGSASAGHNRAASAGAPDVLPASRMRRSPYWIIPFDAMIYLTDEPAAAGARPLSFQTQ